MFNGVTGYDNFMNKVFWICALSLLFLSGCSTAHVERQGPSGGVIARDAFLNLGESKAQLEVRAERQCKQHNPNAKAVLKMKRDNSIVNDFEEWYYTCVDEVADKKVELKTLLSDSKATCKELGFKEGSEKFSNCALKLYTKKIELAAKEKQQVVVQGGSGSNVMTIYDPVRDSNALIKQGQRMMSGRCTLGIDC